MNLFSFKTLTWIASAALGTGLGLYVADFWKKKDTINQAVSRERMSEVLSNVDEIVTVVDKDTVALQGGPYSVYGALTDFPWPGRPPKVEKPVDVKPQEPTKPVDTPVASLIEVVMLKAAPMDDDGCSCVIKYKPEAKINLPDPQHIKRIGDTLDGNLDYISVVAVTGDGVEFAFKDSEREHEVLAPRSDVYFDIPLAQGGGVPQPGPREFARAPQGIFVPRETTKVGESQWYVGTDDAEFLAENWEMPLNEVQRQRHKDPRTGRYDGIQLVTVPPGSFAARHGFQSGDIVKSINGHPVNSEQEAISFAKQNADVYDRWEVVVESYGRERTLTYIPPKTSQ
jgi:hypothetical protein